MRYGTGHYHCKNKKLGLGAGEQLERARREGGGRLEEEECVERGKERERKNEQGTGSLAVATGSRHESDRHFGEGRRLKIQQSAAHCPALSPSLPPECMGGGGWRAQHRLGGFDGVMHLSYGTTTAD